MRHSLDPARDVIQVRVDIPVGVEFGRHSHPGPEIAYVLQGSIEYRIDGKPPVILHEGQALFIPAGAIHAARNVGPVLSTELATYVVDTGKPLVVKAE
jgi:quercetin dioxygenase-like cupin family protein